MDKTVQDYAKRLESIWKAVFGKIPLIEFYDHPTRDEKQGMISWEGFDIFPDEITVETKTIQGTRKEKVAGWVLDMVAYVPGSFYSPPDTDIIDLGEFRNFYDAVRRAIDIHANRIVDGVVENIGITEQIEEEKKLAEELKKS